MENLKSIPGITIKRILSPEDIKASQALRFRVWSAQKNILIKNIKSRRIADDFDAHAYHWGAFNGDKLIGSARLSIHHDLTSVPDAELFAGFPIPLPTASMNRLVVSKSFRGKGIAKKLVELRIFYAQSIGAKSIITTPLINKKSRIDGLLKMGFIPLNREGTAKWADTMRICSMYLPLTSDY